MKQDYRDTNSHMLCKTDKQHIVFQKTSPPYLKHATLFEENRHDLIVKI